MRKIITLLLLGLTLLFVGYKGYQKGKQAKEEKEHQAWVATLTHSASDNVHILEDAVTIDYLGEKRTLAIYLPENYNKDSLSYPVIYFLDGQSLFDQKILEGHLPNTNPFPPLG